jgi:hypothetical protein
MPISRSYKQGTEPPAAATGARFLRPLVLICALAALMVVVIALPASTVKRFLPASVGAEDFSGSLWHGSAGNVTVNARNIGAIEWHLHPWSLLKLAVAADLHWVRIGFLADGTVDFSSHGLTLRNVQGGGPIEDLRDLGIAEGWRGTANFSFSELKVAFANGTAGPRTAGNGAVTITSAVGDVNVSNLASPQVADGADLGGYTLHLADAAVTPGADATADLMDTGGPLEVQATIHFSANVHAGMLSGTIKARLGAPPALLRQLDNLAQLHARDAQGAIPVELEFTL